MSSEEDDEILPKDGEELKTWKDKYTVVKLLGKGGYGAVYKVVRKSDNKPFAVKCEKLSARKKVLPMDCRVLRGAQIIKSCHFCTIEDRGKIENRFIFLVMKLIGRNLWDLRVERESMRFTLNTSLKAAEQCLICIEELHRAMCHEIDVARKPQGTRRVVGWRTQCGSAQLLLIVVENDGEDEDLFYEERWKTSVHAPHPAGSGRKSVMLPPQPIQVKPMMHPWEPDCL
ncbi:hypothetical protein RB195_010402 [Necator americanus]|uniref:Protein kinase domain-containing protein n=1 Tax=Necator americanus TaxID=51031 RepID=A0ABR1CZK7_NECAM